MSNQKSSRRTESHVFDRLSRIAVTGGARRDEEVGQIDSLSTQNDEQKKRTRTDEILRPDTPHDLKA